MRGQRRAPAAPYPRERPSNHCTGGWVGLRAGLDRCGKSHPTRIRSPDRPNPRQLLYWLRYPAHLLCFIWVQNSFSYIKGRTLAEDTQKCGGVDDLWAWVSMNSLTNNTKCLGDQIKEDEMGGMCHVWCRREMHTGFWYRKLKERSHLEDTGIERNTILERIFKNQDGRAWTGLIWLSQEKQYDVYAA